MFQAVGKEYPLNINCVQTPKSVLERYKWTRSEVYGSCPWRENLAGQTALKK